MKLVFLCNRDLASCIALNRLLPDLLADHEIVLGQSARVGRPIAIPALQQLRFAEQTLFNDVVFPLARQIPATQRGPLLGFEMLAEQTGNPLYQFNSINDGEELEQFQALAPDLVVSIRYGVILRQAALAVPRLGVINLHSGRLPDYRGVMASFWALFNGDSELGTTLHFIDDATIDTGRVIATTSLPVQEERSYLWHVLQLYDAGCKAILAAIQTLQLGKELEATLQPGAGNYFTFPEQADLDRFTSLGRQLVDDTDLPALIKQFIKV